MSSHNAQSPQIIQIVGYKNTGKTTMVCRLTERFAEAGYKVGTIKHDAHHFQIDTPDTDTWKHQAAGAHITAISSSERSAVLYQQSQSLDELIVAMNASVDIILIEGFKDAIYPKVIMIRSASDFELIAKLYNPLAVALWPEMHAQAENEQIRVPIVNYNDIEQLFTLIDTRLQL